MENDKIYDALKTIQDMCQQSNCCDCIFQKIMYTEGISEYCNLNLLPVDWDLTTLSMTRDKIKGEQTNGK